MERPLRSVAASAVRLAEVVKWPMVAALLLTLAQLNLALTSAHQSVRLVVCCPSDDCFASSSRNEREVFDSFLSCFTLVLCFTFFCLSFRGRTKEG